MDAFYASVEQRDHPELRGRPIAVGRGEGRGVVATASYEARRYGVHSAMPSYRAKELCPNLIFIHPNMQRYKEVSGAIQAIFRRYTPLVQPISIDEAFLDITESPIPFASGTEAALRIKREIREELSLVASIGVSFNKFLAKIASDWKKPDGLFEVKPEDALRFIDQLPIESFWGIGPATAKKMHGLGISTGEELRRQPLSELVRLFGSAGEIYYSFARGIDPRPVNPNRDRKSVGAETTLEWNAGSAEDVLRELLPVEMSLMRRLARNRFLGDTLTLKLKFADFRQITRSKMAGHPIQDPREVRRLSEELLSDVTIPASGVRLVGLSVSRSEGVLGTPSQPELFSE